MIDYEKIKIATHLGNQLPIGLSVTISINSGSIRDSDRVLCAIQDKNGNIERVEDLEVLICRLEELSDRLDTKYQVGDTVWFLSNGEVRSSKVINIWPESATNTLSNGIQKIEYNLEYASGFFEYELYPSLISLAEHHLEKWAAIYAKESFPCEHEHTFLSGFSCVKCGEKSTRQKYMSKASTGVTQR